MKNISGEHIESLVKVVDSKPNKFLSDYSCRDCNRTGRIYDSSKHKSHLDTHIHRTKFNDMKYQHCDKCKGTGRLSKQEYDEDTKYDKYTY